MWFCGMFKAGYAGEVQDGLRSRGYGAYIPTERKFIVHARRRLEVERPMLGRYLFIMAGDEQDLGPIYGVRGLELVLADGLGRPVKLRPGEVERMIKRQGAGEFDKTRNIAAGDRVMITQHWFHQFLGQMGTVRKIKGMHTPAGAMVTVELEDGKTLVELSEY